MAAGFNRLGAALARASRASLAVIALGTRLPVRGSAFGQLAYRAPGQPRDTGLLQAGLVLVLVGVVIAMARRPKTGV